MGSDTDTGDVIALLNRNHCFSISGEPALPLRWPGHGGGGASAGLCAVLGRVQESARAVHHGDEDIMIHQDHHLHCAGACIDRPQGESRDDSGVKAVNSR